MPIAVGIVTSERKDLKSLEGAFVELRRMTYGEKMHRQGLMSGLKFKSDGQRGSKGFEGEMALANARVTEYEFATCIVSHNLEDVDGRTLNLANTTDLQKLDGKIGEEINTLIDELNQFEGDNEDLGN